MPHVPALVPRPVAVHHPHHLVHRRRPVRRPRQPLVPQTLDPVLLVPARPAPERARAYPQLSCVSRRSAQTEYTSSNNIFRFSCNRLAPPTKIRSANQNRSSL